VRSPVVIAAVTLAAGSAPVAADAAPWRIRTLDAPAGSRLLGLAARGDGRLSALLDERDGHRHRLVVRTGRRGRTLMRGRDSFEGAATTDRRGRLTVAWVTTPRRSRVPQAYVWSGGRAQRLTNGTPGARFIRLAVAPSGAAMVAVTEGEHLLVARRKRPGDRFGPTQALADVAGAPALALAGGAFAVAGEAPGADDGGFVTTVARRLADPFGPTAPSPSPPVPPGRQNVLRSVIAGFAPDGSVVLAYSVMHQRAKASERPTVASSVYASVWPRGAAAPLAPVELSRRRYAYDPARVVSRGRTWLTWLEGDGDCCRTDTVVAAPLVGGGVGDSVQRRLEPGTLAGFEPLAVVAAPGGGLRYYLPDVGRRASLRAIHLSPAGVFGAPERILAGRALAPPNHLVFLKPARGRPADAVGWNGPGAGELVGPIRIARRRG
jgi:hypothetical protein